MGAGAGVRVGRYDVCIRRYGRAPGHLEVLQWAREHDCPWNADQCARFADGSGHAEMAQWVRAQIGPMDAGSRKPGLLNVVAGFLLVGMVILVWKSRRA